MHTNDRIFIKNLKARGIIGVQEQERETTQDILISATLFTDISRAAQTDNIEDCVDYEDLSNRILRSVQDSKRYTVEALAEDIAQLCLEHPKVKRVRIKINKPAAIQEAKGAGVIIIRGK